MPKAKPRTPPPAAARQATLPPPIAQQDAETRRIIRRLESD